MILRTIARGTKEIEALPFKLNVLAKSPERAPAAGARLITTLAPIRFS